MVGDMPAGAEHMQGAEIERNAQSLAGIAAEVKKLANLYNPEKDAGPNSIEGSGLNAKIEWEKDEKAGKLIAHMTVEQDGNTVKKDVVLVDITGGKSQNPVYEEESAARALMAGAEAWKQAEKDSKDSSPGGPVASR